MEIESWNWLKEDFIRRILWNLVNKEKIVVTSIAMKPAVAKGDNYGVVMIRASVDYSDDKSGSEAQEKIASIIQIASIPKDVNNDMNFCMAYNVIGASDILVGSLGLYNARVTSETRVMEGEKLDWLNAEYIQKILRKYENDSSILVTSLTSEPATAKGDNYGSIMIRVKVSYSSSKSGVERNEKRSLVIKSTPSLEGVQKEMLGQCSVFENEIRMMETTLERMNEIVNEDDFRFQARVLHSQIGDPSLLVMEDLTALGFRVANRRTGLDFDHCVVALQGLAKFHAASVALYEKDPSSMATYNYGIYHKDQPQGIKDFFIMAMKQVAKEVDTWDELGPSCHSYSKKLMEFTKICFEETEKIAKPKEGDFNVLNHGDFWVTNMLFRYDANGKINGHIFADFQMPFFTSPAIDLLYFFATSSSEDVELNHQDALIEKYLEALMSTLQKLGCRTKPPTLDELKASMKERELYALMSSCAVLPIVVVDETHVTDFNGLIEKRDNNPMYKGLGFRKIMVRRLPYYDSLGLFNS